MDTQTTSTEEALRTLLERTAAQQASLDALAASVAELRDGQRLMQAAIIVLQVDVAGIKGTMAQYATHADVERIRADLYKAIHEQTMCMLVWMTAVCSGLTVAVYYIARNVH